MNRFNHLEFLPVAFACAFACGPHEVAVKAPSKLAQQGMHVDVYSESATRIEAWIYSQPTGARAALVLNLKQDPVTARWSGFVSTAALINAGVTDEVYYGFRAWGPNWPYDSSWMPGRTNGFSSDVDQDGHRFNPNKLLIDPYAREISHDPVTASHSNGADYASGPASRAIDTGPFAPKSVLLPPDSTSTGSKPTRAFKDDIIYEVHVRGLTKNDSSIPPAVRGTYAGAALKAPALAALGVTAVEFLPVQETQNDQNDNDPSSTSGDNYWGYVTLGYFAPDRRYAADRSIGGPTREFKQMVAAFHAHGIKVLIDVVYNHTGEGGVHRGGDNRVMNLLSWRGLDNPTYYSLTANRQFPWDNTGVGGNFNTFNPAAQKLIVDSLKYWRDDMGVDGFRFDLASVLGNVCEHGCFHYDKINPATALNRIARELTPRAADGGAGVDLIAEPWAIGGNSYQVGNFPAGWSEWNGQYRDTIRKDQNQMGVASLTLGALATRLAGSYDLYQDDGRKPWNSVNFIVAHDGMTLNDLYACNSKNNLQPWPNGPSDGGEDHNQSWDHHGIAADQRKAARTGFGLMMLSGGTPMLTGGDEHLRTQRCNNNVYNLDSPANWLDYGLDGDQQNFRVFAERMIHFRRTHDALRPRHFYSANDNNGNAMEQLRWFKPDGHRADGAYLDSVNNHALAWRYDGTEFGDVSGAIYVAYNGWSGSVSYQLPWPGAGRAWYRTVDTCNWAEGPDQFRAPGSEDFIGGEGTSYGVCGRGLLVLIAK